MEHEKKLKDEPLELKHDPVPGFRTAFFIILAAAVVYLGIIFLIKH